MRRGLVEPQALRADTAQREVGLGPDLLGQVPQVGERRWQPGGQPRPSADDHGTDDDCCLSLAAPASFDHDAVLGDVVRRAAVVSHDIGGARHRKVVRVDGVDRQHFEDLDTRGGPAHQLLDGVGVQHRSSAGPLEPVEKHVPGFREAKGGELLDGLGENGLA